MRISPASGGLDLRLGSPGNAFVRLSVTNVAALRIAENAGDTVLTASFAGESGRGILKLRLKPEPPMEWTFERT